MQFSNRVQLSLKTCLKARCDWCSRPLFLMCALRFSSKELGASGYGEEDFRLQTPRNWSTYRNTYFSLPSFPLFLKHLTNTSLSDSLPRPPLQGEKLGGGLQVSCSCLKEECVLNKFSIILIKWQKFETQRACAIHFTSNSRKDKNSTLLKIERANMSVPVFRTDWLLSNTAKFWEMTNESVTASVLYIYAL